MLRQRRFVHVLIVLSILALPQQAVPACGEVSGANGSMVSCWVTGPPPHLLWGCLSECNV